jgi:hypothetical protein
MFSAKNKQSPGEIPGAVTSLRSPKTVGRERLRFAAGEVAKANEAVADLEQRVARFSTIIADADTNHRALQDAINADGGRALAEYSAGKSDPDSEITRLVTLAESSAKASNAAKAALPNTEAMLASARSQVTALGDQRAAELNRVVAMLADADARAYQKAFEEMCRLHDRLVGYASVAQASIGDVQLILDPIKTPRFALPSLGNSDADPFLRHREDELVVADAARQWATVRQRIDADVDADLDDLI